MCNVVNQNSNKKSSSRIFSLASSSSKESKILFYLNKLKELTTKNLYKLKLMIQNKRYLSSQRLSDKCRIKAKN